MKDVTLFQVDTECFLFLQLLCATWKLCHLALAAIPCRHSKKARSSLTLYLMYVLPSSHYLAIMIIEDLLTNDHIILMVISNDGDIMLIKCDAMF